MINALKRAFKTVGKSLSALALAGSILMPFGAAGCGKSIPAPHVNNAPILASIADQSIQANSPYSFNVNTNQGTDKDQDGDTVTYEFTQNPTGMSINPGNGVITWTPNPDTQLGNYTIGVKCIDGHGLQSAEETFDLLAHSVYTDKTGKLEQIVLTDNAFASTAELQNFVLKENRSGTPTEVVTIEEIESNSQYDSDPLLPDKIESCLEDEIAAHSNFKKLWIVGDSNVVPAKMVHCETVSGAGVGFGNNTACDLYYACANGRWDGNSNGIIGELEDGVDLHPKLYVTRAPVNTTGDLINILNKMQIYENSTDIDYIKSIHGYASMIGSTDLAIDVDYTLNTTYNFPTNGWKVTRWYQTGINSAGVETKTDVLNSMNSGPNLAIVDADGCETFFDAVTGDITNADVDTLTNSTKPSIYYLIVCAPGDFSYSTNDCLVERLINNTNGGAVAAIASSWLSVGSSPGMGPNWHICNDFFDRVINGNTTEIGEAMANTKDYFATAAQINKDYNTMVKDLNVLGAKPGMKIRKNCYGTLDVIANSYPQGISYTVTSASSPVSGANFTITTNTGKILYTVTNASGQVLFDVPQASITSAHSDKQDYVSYESP